MSSSLRSLMDLVYQVCDNICTDVGAAYAGSHTLQHLNAERAHSSLTRIGGRAHTLRALAAQHKNPQDATDGDAVVLLPTSVPNMTIRLPARIENGVVIINADIEQIRSLINS